MIVRVLLVAAGGALGALSRFGIVQAFPKAEWLAVAVANTIGCLILGYLKTAFPNNSYLLLSLGVGFCGALTTFSSFIFEAVHLKSILISIAYILCSLVLGILAFKVGAKLHSVV